jgi:hypothetical protein
VTDHGSFDELVAPTDIWPDSERRQRVSVREKPA